MVEIFCFVLWEFLLVFWVWFGLLEFFPPKTELFTESVLRIGSVFIWFVISSVHVYALFTFLQNVPSV